MWKTLSIIAALLLAGAGAVSHLKKQDIADARKDLQLAQDNQANLVELAESIDGDQGTIEQKKAKLEAVKEKGEANKTELTDLEERLEAMKLSLEEKDVEKQEAQDALAGMKEKIAVIGRIDELKDVITGLQAEKNAAEGKVANLKSQLFSAINEKNTTDSALNRVKTTELDKASGRMLGSFSTRVGNVDSSWRYITINAGDRQGVVKDAILEVVRGGNVIGKVRVSNVEPTRSAADVVPGSFIEGSSVRPGDQLRVAPESRSKNK
ncbi:MAG: small-conductance mechanosensitive channel [Verrucomicrobiales bacterium]|jgi:small-conductance mechanosensitive channel